MAGKLMTLEDWGRAKYGERAPFIGTLRRWVRDGKIFPPPEKHGRAYYLTENAKYMDNFDTPAFLRELRDATQTQ